MTYDTDNDLFSKNSHHNNKDEFDDFNFDDRA